MIDRCLTKLILGEKPKSGIELTTSGLGGKHCTHYTTHFTRVSATSKEINLQNNFKTKQSGLHFS